MSTYEETVQIKQQVFQVISNKYSSGQTDRLIKDIDKIAKAITDKPAQVAEGKPAAYRPEATTDTFLFLGGDIDGEDRNMHCDTKGMPLAVECYPSDSDCTYHRNSMKIGFNDVFVTHYFYSEKKNYVPSSVKALALTMQKLIDFRQAKR